MFPQMETSNQIRNIFLSLLFTPLPSSLSLSFIYL